MIARGGVFMQVSKSRAVRHSGHRGVNSFWKKNHTNFNRNPLNFWDFLPKICLLGLLWEILNLFSNNCDHCAWWLLVLIIIRYPLLLDLGHHPLDGFPSYQILAPWLQRGWRTELGYKIQKTYYQHSTSQELEGFFYQKKPLILNSKHINKLCFSKQNGFLRSKVLNLVIDRNPIFYFQPNQNRNRNAVTETESKPKVNRKY